MYVYVYIHIYIIIYVYVYTSYYSRTFTFIIKQMFPNGQFWENRITGRILIFLSMRPFLLFFVARVTARPNQSFMSNFW